jgi:hypothetical protein
MVEAAALTPDKNAPLAVFLASDAANRRHRAGVRHADARDLPVQLAAAGPDHAPRRRLDAGTIAQHAIPAVQAAFMPLDTSEQAFPWDPV